MSLFPFAARAIVAAVCALAVAGVAAAPATAQTRCSTRWHTIRHAESGTMLQPNGGGIVQADGIAGVAPWNQYVLFCRDPIWEQGHYGIYANRTAKYWFSTIGLNVVAANAPRIETETQLFEVRRYSGVFWTIRWVGPPGTEVDDHYLRPVFDDATWFHNPILEATTHLDYLSGANLFTISPSGNLLG